MTLRLGVIWVFSTLVAQAVPNDQTITTLIGSGVTTGTVVGYAWWRQRHADELVKTKDAQVVELTKILVDRVIPALEATAHANNETRRALEKVLDSQRGDHGSYRGS